MLGNSLIGGRSSSTANNRVFVYEVTGLKQNEVTTVIVILSALVAACFSLFLITG